MKPIPILRVVATVAASLLVVSGVVFLSRVAVSGSRTPPGFVLMYGVVPLIAFPIYLLSARIGKWAVASLWGVFISMTAAVTWDVWRWCTPWECGERDFWSIIRVQVVANPLLLLTFVLALAAHVQYSLQIRFNAKD